MARTTRSRSRISRGPRRKLVWARHASSVLVNEGGLLSIFPLSAFEGTYGAQLIGSTVMRVRGVICVALFGSSAGTPANGAIRVAARITDHADLAGQDYTIGALYGNQAQADWFMFEPFLLDNGGAALNGTEEGDMTSASEIRHIDVRARRKFQELDQTVEMLIGSPAVDAPPGFSSSVRVSLDLSFLIALP